MATLTVGKPGILIISSNRGSFGLVRNVIGSQVWMRAMATLTSPPTLPRLGACFGTIQKISRKVLRRSFNKCLTPSKCSTTPVRYGPEPSPQNTLCAHGFTTLSPSSSCPCSLLESSRTYSTGIVQYFMFLPTSSNRSSS